MRDILVNHNRQKFENGISLFSLMVGIAISSFLMLMIAQLASLSKKNYIYAANIIGVYDNGREAIQFLRKNAQMAGFGINQPTPPASTTVQLDSGSSNPAGGWAVLSDWSYIGFFQPVGFTPTPMMAVVSPSSCGSAGLTKSLTTPLNFFGLANCGNGICLFDNGTVSRSFFQPFSTYNTAGPCRSNVSNCSGPTQAPYYNCGGSMSNAMAVYQKLIRPACVGNGSCLFTLSSITPSGDVLSLHFSNPDPYTITTFAGRTVSSAATDPPPDFTRYVFLVDQATSTLRALDTTTDMTTASYTGSQFLNVVPNIEYMAVLLGESDLYSTVTGGYSVPTLSRYYGTGTANQYLYRVWALRVALVVRSQDQILPSSSSSTLFLMYGNDGASINYTTPADRYMRKVFTTTIFLSGYNLPPYQPHCVTPSGSTSYRLKTGGIPFATTWTTNDQCCKGSPCKTYDWATCETQRMAGGCW